MTRVDRSKRRNRLPRVEALEGRHLPTAGFLSGIGLPATGSYAAIHANASATDAAGDQFVVGSFRGTVAFDPSSSASTFSTANTEDAFVAEYGPTGSLTWVRTFVGQATVNQGGFTTYATSQVSAIAVDALGNIFIAGSFNGSVRVTTTTVSATQTSVAQATEPFVARLDGSGRVFWFDGFAGMAYDTDAANALAVVGSGGVVVAGSFAESATFGTTTLTASGSSEAFVARVDGSGRVVWAVASRGMNGSNASIAALALDGSGNVALAGSYSGTIDADPSASTALVTSAGSVDALAWKLDPNGSFLWARSFGSTDYDAATALAIDASGNLLVTGAFSETVNFGTNLRPDRLTAGPLYNAFVLKLDPLGNETWARGLIGSSGSSKGQGVAVDASGNAHVAGTFAGPIDFDPGPGLDVLTSVGSSDAFLAGYDPTGALVYALQAGQTNFNAVLGIALNASGTATLAGTYSGTIRFGSSSLPNSSNPAGFVAQAMVASPPPPAPSSPVLEAASDTGTSHSDGITSATSPVFDVTLADASDTVRLLRDGVVVASRLGPGALTDPGPVAEGVHAYVASQASPAGLVGPSSGSTTIRILTTPPSPPPAPTLLPADDSGTAGDGITNVRQPRLSVAAKGGTTVELLSAAGAVIGRASQAADGASVLAPFQPLADGSYAIRARITDLAGNVGQPGPSFTLTIDATPPVAPQLPALLAADDSGTLGDGITNVRQPRLSGMAEPNATVKLVDSAGRVYGSGVAAGDGTTTIRLNSILADGTYAISARATDAAGNLGASGPAFSLTILATGPASPTAPALLAADDSGTLGDGITRVRQPRLTGRAAPNLTVRLVGSSGNLLASTTAGSDGTYVAAISSPLADGTYAVQAVAVDAAGNASPPSPAFSLTILATPPSAPSAPSLLPADDSGTLGDGTTNVRQARLTATAPATLMVRLVNGSGQVLGTATASGTGALTIAAASPLADGTYSLALVAIDAAGNLSPLGPAFTLTILATPPATPSAPTLLAADDTGTLGDGLTTVRRPRIVGTAKLGLRVNWLSATGSVVASTTAAASTGAYQFQPSTALANGVVSIRVQLTDVAGNSSATSLALNLTIRVAPGDDFGDAVTDISVFRPSDAVFFVQKPATGALFAQQFGGKGDVPVNGDFFGNGHNDIAVYRPSTGTFYAIDPVTSAFTTVSFGQPGDLPTPADFDGDGLTDFAVYRPSTSSYGIRSSATGAISTRQFGGTGDVPVPADYFGDSHADYAVYRPSNATFYVLNPSTGAARVVTVGLPNATPVPADFEGIGRVDPAVYQSGNSTYLIQMTTSNVPFTRQFGGTGDIPIPGDFLGTGRADLAVFRPSTATFYALDLPTNASKVLSFGTPNAMWPTLAPLSTWSSYGGPAGRNSIARPLFVEPSRGVIAVDLAVPPPMDASPPPPVKTLIARPTILPLGLDAWRHRT